MVTMIDAANQRDEEMKEAETTKKTRMTKLFDYNTGKDILQRKLDITLEQGCQLSPTIRQQVIKEMQKIKPSFEIIEVNSTDIKEKLLRKSSAYTQCHLEGQVADTIIDTGAGGCLISNIMLEKIGWAIEALSNLTIVVADGHEAVPLGIVFDLPVMVPILSVSVS